MTLIYLLTKLKEEVTEELKTSIVDDLKGEFENLKNNFQPKQPTKYLTRNEVATMLKIDLSSVHNWTKKGKLKSYGIGGRVYYKLTEMEKAIVKLD